MGTESREHLGFVTKNFLPDRNGSLGVITDMVKEMRETFVGWAQHIPVLNLITRGVRLVI